MRLMCSCVTFAGHDHYDHFGTTSFICLFVDDPKRFREVFRFRTSFRDSVIN
jgi:hypothetical protein